MFWCTQFGCKVSSSCITVFKPKQVWQNPYYYNPTFYYRYKLTSLPPQQFASVSKFNSHYLKFDGKPIGWHAGTQLCLKLSNIAERKWITFLHWKWACLNTKSQICDSSVRTMNGLWARRFGVHFLEGTKILLFFTATRPALGVTPAIRQETGWVPYHCIHSGEEYTPCQRSNSNSSTARTVTSRDIYSRLPVRNQS
jgi:hypothetical protein